MRREAATAVAFKGDQIMFRFSLAFLSTALLASTAWAQSVAVTLSLESSKNGQTVTPGAAIDWTISVTVPAGGNAGLAAVSIDLTQASGNPAFIDLPPAGDVPAGMENFSRPLGVSNPGENGAATGYIGVQRSPTGQGYKDLVQVGGAQNTFGSTLPSESGVAQTAMVVSGVGQGASPQIIASGSFQAPGTAGTYTLQLENAVANVLGNVSPPPLPPDHWPVARPTVNTASASFSFVVEGIVRGDLNCDGLVNEDDIPHFAQALIDPAGYDADHDGSPYALCQRVRADMNEDTRQDGLDIQSFLNALLASP